MTPRSAARVRPARTQPVIAAIEPRHYAQYGIARGDIAPFEDGLRTDPGPGTYEWWYFDAHLDDGTKLVIGFYTKDFANPRRGLEPVVTIDIDLPDGTTLHKRKRFTAGQFSASTETCDVRIGDNRFSGDLHDYVISATIDEVTVEVRLSSLTEPWRPETGHLHFGHREDRYFAWLPSVPFGSVEATYAVDGTTRTSPGSGYHDHNWGNASLLTLINNWYWGRGRLGPYTFVSAYIATDKKYGHTAAPIFMLARDGKVIADDSNRVTFTASRVATDPLVRKPVADVTEFDYRDGATRYLLRYTRDRTILRARFVDGLPRWKKALASLVRFDGAYLRFAGTLSIDHFEGDELVDHYEDDALWELMYLGRVTTSPSP